MHNNKELITTAIAYANGAPHIGHAFEFVLSDVVARYRRTVLGRENVWFITGMDEHGQKIEQKAKENGTTVQAFVDGHANTFKELDATLDISYDFFVRTSDKELHYKGATYLWNKLQEVGALEKRTYKALYCVGCEEFKKEGDLDEKGECRAHLKKPEVVEEENWFFKLSKYTKDIEEKIKNDELKIYPESRKNEILALLSRGLEDVSFSRPKSKVSWGIPVPNDDTQVMYVWCDALSNYITALGYGRDDWESKREFWDNATHVIGKDILRFHAAIWPGMLIATGLPLPQRILVHGHITSGGQKMSKTLGNVIDPQTLLQMFAPVTEYSGEVVRFLLLHEIPTFDDGDMTIDSLKSAYTAHLVNGIGNLTSRIMKLVTTHGVVIDSMATLSLPQMKDYDVRQALNGVTLICSQLDKKIQDTEPFKVVKVDVEKGKKMIGELVTELKTIAENLEPFMPHTSAKILECIRENKMPEKPLFGRL
jgi:methionyl-tRNA synthetase